MPQEVKKIMITLKKKQGKSILNKYTCFTKNHTPHEYISVPLTAIIIKSFDKGLFPLYLKNVKSFEFSRVVIVWKLQTTDPPQWGWWSFLQKHIEHDVQFCFVKKILFREKIHLLVTFLLFSRITYITN